ncbi:MAG: hypothetical protein O7B26_13875, partial [Planctomycetota bacterium]|nr:hypothetical protein [Planctomycetota bacterium]
IARHDMDGDVDWHEHVITQTDLDAAEVTLSSNMRLRIIANDDDPQGIVEAAFDAVLISGLNCIQAFPDCNHNGEDDAMDIALGESLDCNGDGVPDECQPDTDGDGVIDPCDGCPNDPAKSAPGDCGCGAPDVDGDGDGVLDCNDICPGFDDTLDADGDGTPDGCDGCPNDPNKTAPGVCGCGAPDVDSDGDGVLDCNDICPGFDDTLDADDDGTPDCNDGCPNDPNKLEPGMCGCGVIDPPIMGDMNDDGVLNGIDIRYFVVAVTRETPTPEEICRGDTNGSGDLDADDIPGLIVRLIPEICGQADMNGDGKLDGRDINRFVKLVVNGTANELDICRGDLDGSEALDSGDIPGLVNALLTVP